MTALASAPSSVSDGALPDAGGTSPVCHVAPPTSTDSALTVGKRLESRRTRLPVLPESRRTRLPVLPESRRTRLLVVPASVAVFSSSSQPAALGGVNSMTAREGKPEMPASAAASAVVAAATAASRE